LTAAQCRFVAVTDSYCDWYCLECARKVAEEEAGVPCPDDDTLRMWVACQADEGWSAYIEYTMGEIENEGMGIYCSQCEAELRPPYCVECGATLTGDNQEEGGVDGWPDPRPICDSCATPEEEEE